MAKDANDRFFCLVNQSPRNEINYLIATLFSRFKIFTLQPFHYSQSILSLSVCQRSERMHPKRNYRSQLDRVILITQLLYICITCNIAQNWKSIVEEITRDRFTLRDLFHETRATYRKRVIKTVLRDSLYNIKRYDYVIFRWYATWALLFGLGLDGPE